MSETEVSDLDTEGKSHSESDLDDTEEGDLRESESEDEEAVANKKQTVPFGVRLQQQQSGASSFKASSRRQTQESRAKLHSTVNQPKYSFKRENKNRPRELSSKRPVPRFREVIESENRQSRDPRFDSLSGKLRDDIFKKRYSFLYDEQLPDERQQIQRAMKKTKSATRKKELQGELTRVQQQIRHETSQRKAEEVQRQAKAKEKEAVKAGKRPFFMKKSEKKRQELIQKYNDLKASGGLQKAIAKRRRKNAAKDHRYIPTA